MKTGAVVVTVEVRVCFYVTSEASLPVVPGADECGLAEKVFDSVGKLRTVATGRNLEI